jgi:hypothetical protein
LGKFTSTIDSISPYELFNRFNYDILLVAITVCFILRDCNDGASGIMVDALDSTMVFENIRISWSGFNGVSAKPTFDVASQ